MHQMCTQNHRRKKSYIFIERNVNVLFISFLDVAKFVLHLILVDVLDESTFMFNSLDHDIYE